MKAWKKTLVGGLTAILLGFSCCWISALAIWLGGAAVLGGLTLYLESIQIPLILLGALLIIIAIIRFH